MKDEQFKEYFLQNLPDNVRDATIKLCDRFLEKHLKEAVSYEQYLWAFSTFKQFLDNHKVSYSIPTSVENPTSSPYQIAQGIAEFFKQTKIKMQAFQSFEQFGNKKVNSSWLENLEISNKKVNPSWLETEESNSNCDNPIDSRKIVIKINGKERQQFQEALISAFPSKSALEQMVSFELNKNLDEIAMGENYSEIVFKLIEWAEAQGKVKELLTAARNSNPGNLELQNFEQQIK